jgi:hypothetical protein
MPEMSQCAVIVLFFISVLESLRGMPEVVEALSEKEPFPNTTQQDPFCSRHITYTDGSWALTRARARRLKGQSHDTQNGSVSTLSHPL